jgi:hypothetical protein
MSTDTLPGVARVMERKIKRRRKAGIRSSGQKSPIKPPNPGLQMAKALSRLLISMALP